MQMKEFGLGDTKFIFMGYLSNKKAIGPWIAHLSPAHKMMYWPVAKEKDISIFSSGSQVVQLS